MENISIYKTLAFDCDGVILDSNRVKTEAFYKVALPFGEDNARTLVEYHRERGGVSRYEKFEYFLREIAGIQIDKQCLESLLHEYSVIVKQGLLNCNIATGLEELRKMTHGANWMLVSGGDQSELRNVFSQRKIDKLFDCGIWGSPDDKDTILTREIEARNLNRPALFLGDSRYDHEAAVRAGLDFVFVAEWTEFDSWELYCHKNNIPWVANLSEFLMLYSDTSLRSS